MKMCWFGIFILVFLSGCCQPGGAEIELSPKIVYELLSVRIDNVIRETQSHRSEFTDTKAVVEKIEQKLERINANMPLMERKVVLSEKENLQSLVTENVKVIQDASKHFIREKLKTELKLLRKMLIKEKSHLRKRVMTLENKIKNLESEFVKHQKLVNNSMENKIDKLKHSMTEHKLAIGDRLTLAENEMQKSFNETDLLFQGMTADFENNFFKLMTLMNDSMERKVDNLKHSMTEHKIVVDNRLTLAEKEIQNSFNKTEMTFQEISANFENELIESNAKLKEIEMVFSENITNISKRLSTVNTNLTDTKSGLNGRLDNAESYLRTMSSKLGIAEIHIPENGYLLGKKKNLLLNEETYRICCKNGFEVKNDGIFPYGIETCKTIQNDNGILKPKVQCLEERCDPTNLLNGYAEYENNSRIWSKFPSGLSIFLFCEDGFKFYDSSGEPIQTTLKRQCKKGDIINTPTCIEAKCLLAEQPSNQFTRYRNPDTAAKIATNETINSGETIEVYCDNQYELCIDDSKEYIDKSFIAKCTKGNFDKDKFPVCRETKCTLAEHTSNPFTRYRNPDTMAQISSEDYIDPGKRIEVLCDNLYELYINDSKEYIDTPFIARCQKGMFNNGKFPVCVESIRCPSLPQIKNGWVFQDTSYGLVNYIDSVVEYGCNRGFYLNGITQLQRLARTCQADRTWSGQEPVCESLSYIASYKGDECAHSVEEEIQEHAQRKKKPALKLYKYACNPDKANYAVVVKIDMVSDNQQASTKIARGLVKISLNKGIEGLEEGDEMTFFWKYSCKYPIIEEGKEYLIIGRDGYRVECPYERKERNELLF